MGRKRVLPGFNDQAPPDRYCDLVLTGGVTSAIAYPGVIHGLAQAYRLNSIGGSSSGAGSAALAAAAEYRRRHGSTEGFRTLLRRTAEVGDDFRGRTGLDWLFQPDPQSRRLFKALLPAFAGPDKRRGRFFAGVLRAYGGAALAGFVACAALPLLFGALVRTSDWSGWAYAAVLTGLLGAVVETALRMWGDLRQTADADFGLCSGQRQSPDAPHQPITPWLHDLIQDIAGLPPARPLTFADLQSAPGGPRETLGDMSTGGSRSIDLRMFAANVSLGRPQLLPQGDDEPLLYFRPRELLRLFPSEVVTFMQRSSAVYDGPVRVMEPAEPPRPPRDGDDFWALPTRELPVLVAARMSVSFPLLFSAVPLWQRVAGGRRFRRLLFADGGLCSNFPIHLFDSPIPAWPTFGVALHDDGGDAPADPVCSAAWVHMPQDHEDRLVDRWRDFDRHDQAAARVLAFAGALLSTTKDWNDALLAELPGVRERIAQVALPADIGGLNILMSAAQIEWLAEAGGEAARQLLQRYATPGPGGAQAAGWREHRWVRFNILACCLQDTLIGLSRAAQFERHAEPLRAQIGRATIEPPLARTGAPALQPAQAAALERTLDALLEMERALLPRPLAQPYQPMPRPELRIRPPM